MKDYVPRELRSRVIYKSTYACCNASISAKTAGRHFSTTTMTVETFQNDVKKLALKSIYFVH